MLLQQGHPCDQVRGGIFSVAVQTPEERYVTQATVPLGGALQHH